MVLLRLPASAPGSIVAAYRGGAVSPGAERVAPVTHAPRSEEISLRPINAARMRAQCDESLSTRRVLGIHPWQPQLSVALGADSHLARGSGALLLDLRRRPRLRRCSEASRQVRLSRTPGSRRE